MAGISREFAPPFKLIAPYFILASVFYLLSTAMLFQINVTQNASAQDLHVVSWTHLYLLGFVMMTMFGAMAQLIPVVLERGHAKVSYYYAIWPLLGIGVLLMSYGFMYNFTYLSIGGTLVLLSMFIFSMELFFTLGKLEKLDIVIFSVLISNIFLLTGVILGLLMALSFSGLVDIDIANLLKAHVYMVIGGYVLITIMSFSYIMLPMFGLSHGFSKKTLEIAIVMQCLGVFIVFISAILGNEILGKVGYLFSFLSILVYFYLIYLINKTRARKENDMYIMSLFASFAFFALALVFGALYLFNEIEIYLFASTWLLFIGFFGFLITGHLYKIVPFLVWYERFSPLVGKQKVPMLFDMVPTKSANIQILLTCSGIVLVLFAILFQNNTLHVTGASFLTLGAGFLVYNLIYMIRYK